MMRKRPPLWLHAALVLLLIPGFAGAQDVKAEDNIETDGQLVSNVATGTTPLAVSSMTRVPNLNADLLDGLHASELALETDLQTAEALIVEQGGVLDCLESLLDGRVMTETENNNSIATADTICFGQASGVVTGAEDYFSQAGAREGNLVFAYLDGFLIGLLAATDLRLTVYANDGTQLEVDDGDGPVSACVIAGLEVPAGQSGEIFFRVEEDGGDAEVIYRLYTVVSYHNTTESEPNDSFVTADPISDATVVNGAVTTGLDYFAFFAPAGAQIVVMVDDNPDGDAFFTDTELTIYDPDMATVLGVGDDFSLNAGNAVVADTVNGGVHYLEIARGTVLDDSDYRFVVRVYPGQGLS